MKKRKWILPTLLATVLLMGLFSGCTAEEAKQETITVFDARGEVLATVAKAEDIYRTEHWAYLEIVLSEMTEITAKQNGISTEEAQKQLFSEAYQVHTSFDAVTFEALKTVEPQWKEACDAACAITDLKGNLLAVYSSDVANQQLNHAQQRRDPCSSFKALSVYTPAVEKGKIIFSSMYEDSPYKQIKLEDGTLEDWPTNASGTCTRENTTVYDALRKSLNTVAVRCLADVGAGESIKFLQTAFGIPLTEEEYVVENYGEEEVIGNMALGFLETGITPVEMAGYYQVFASGGLYAEPRAVSTIALEDGKVLYTRNDAQKQVISPATADVMNKLLKGVVAPGGTGEAAACSDVEVAGKTGTGNDFEDNWFVGVTPGYSLAVWHGQSGEGNQAAEMFAAVIEKLYEKQPNANRKFVTHKNLYKIAYCVKSGKAFSDSCTTIETGYFTSKDALPVCDTCGKE